MTKSILKCAAVFIFLFLFRVLNSTASNSILNTGTWYKFSAKETGIYVITFNDLQNLGINLSVIDPRNISIYSNGAGELPRLNGANRPIDLQEIAIEIKDESDGVFNQGDTIFFYNKSQTTWNFNQNKNLFEHYSNIYTDSCSFFLTVNSFNGKRINTIPSLPTFTNSTSTFTDYFIHEIDSVNFLHSGKKWFGEEFDVAGNSMKSFSFPSQWISNVDSLKMEISFAARSTVDVSTLSVLINGATINRQFSLVGTTPQDNFGMELIINSALSAPILSGNIDLTFQSMDATALGWLNYIQLNYISSLNLHQSQMNFRDSRVFGLGVIMQYNLSGLTNDSKIWDVTDFSNVKDQSFSSSPPFNNFNALNDVIREYIAFDGRNYYTPSFIGIIPNQNLHSIDHANMVIITAPQFSSSANILAQHHQLHDSLDVIVADVNQIYNEYSSGQQDPIAIRDFIRQVYEHSGALGDSLKYVLLFGSASYDYKNHNGYGESLIPTDESDFYLNQTNTYSTDDIYSTLDSSEGEALNVDIPDVAIGRIPAKISSEANIVNKIINYQTSSYFNSWRLKVVGVADDAAFNLFMRQTDTLLNRIENNNCELYVDKVYLDAYPRIVNGPGYSYPDAENKFKKSIKDGSVLIEYNGFGNSQVLADEIVLTANYLDTVMNFNTLPFYVFQSVGTNVMDDPQIDPIGRRLLFNPSGGGIGSIGSGRISFFSSNYNFYSILNKNIFDNSSGKWPTIGESFLATKKRMHIDLYTYSNCLIGDPAVRLLLPENKVIVTFLSSDTMVAGQQVLLSGEIQDISGGVINSFNGTIDITIYNNKTLHYTLGNDPQSSIQPFSQWDDTLYNADVSVINGVFNLNFIVPPTIDSGYGLGKINFYAQNGLTDAAGCYGNFILKGALTSINDFSEIQIQIFPNPSSGIIYCSIGNKVNSNWSYSLLSVDGKVQIEKKITASIFEIDRNGISSGLYFLKIKNEKNQVVSMRRIVFD